MTATTYTTKAGNLWVWTLGSTADCWIRQMDRARMLSNVSETDTDAVERYDRDYPISLWFRLGHALGLKGGLLLHREGNGLHTLYEGDRPVHVFANGAYECDLPVTVVPLLLETDNEPDLTAILEAILAVVEAKPPAVGRLVPLDAALQTAAVAERKRRDLEHAATIARLDALIALNLSGLEPRSKTDPRTYSPKHSERVDIALEVERLTAARLNLLKAGPS